MNTETMISIAIGSLGAVTGVVALGWNVISSRPKIKLESSWEVQEDNGMEEHTLKIINLRDKPIKIRSFGYMSKKGETFPYMCSGETEVPGRDTIEVHWDLDGLIDDFSIETRRTFNRLYAEDGVGYFYTKKIKKS